jgi:hypothetical protein
MKFYCVVGKPENITEEWNGFPGLQNLFDNLDGLKKARVTYHGYVVDRDRDDWRVSVEGFDVFGLTADETLDLQGIYQGSADELDHTKQKDGTYSLYAWWD